MSEEITLPPDPDQMNDERAARMGEPIVTYAKTVGLHDGVDFTDDVGSIISDMLCDLRHWCDRQDIDFDTRLGVSKINYNCETEEL